jgi:hypothetical protein
MSAAIACRFVSRQHVSVSWSFLFGLRFCKGLYTRFSSLLWPCSLGKNPFAEGITLRKQPGLHLAQKVRPPVKACLQLPYALDCATILEYPA